MFKPRHIPSQPLYTPISVSMSFILFPSYIPGWELPWLRNHRLYPNELNFDTGVINLEELNAWVDQYIFTIYWRYKNWVLYSFLTQQKICPSEVSVFLADVEQNPCLADWDHYWIEYHHFLLSQSLWSITDLLALNPEISQVQCSNCGDETCQRKSWNLLDYLQGEMQA